MYNFYEHLNGKRKKAVDNTNNFYHLLNVALAMFDWKNVPETIPPEFIETFLLMNGTVGMGKYKGDLYAGMGGYCGNFDGYLPDSYVFSVPNIDTIQGKINKDVCVGWNNATRTPDFNLLKYTSIFTEIDTSERLNVIYSRFLRIPKAKDNKEKVAIENAIKDIFNGNITAITSNNVQDLLGESGEKFLDLVDIKDIDKLQYLNQYYNNVLKRFYQEYGHPMQITEKLSQQTNDEVHGGDSVSMILPLQKLKYRQQFCDDCNKLFGTDMSVDFSELWEINTEMVEQTVETEGGTEDVENTQDSGDTELHIDES